MFSFTRNPTPFGFFDTDVDFQQEADACVTFTKRKLGDDILSVELTKKQIWACLEEGMPQSKSEVPSNRPKSGKRPKSTKKKRMQEIV